MTPSGGRCIPERTSIRGPIHRLKVLHLISDPDYVPRSHRISQDIQSKEVIPIEIKPLL